MEAATTAASTATFLRRDDERFGLPNVPTSRPRGSIAVSVLAGSPVSPVAMACSSADHASARTVFEGSPKSAR
jgi:hypothetical protein